MAGLGRMTLAFTASWTVVILSVLASWAGRSLPPWVGLAMGLVALGALSAALLFVVGSVVHPRFSSEAGSFVATSEEIFVAFWWLLSARAVLGLGRVALRIDPGHRSARLATDLVEGAVYLAAALAILDLAFGVSLTGLIATSGIIAIVLGLAMQSTLGDLFSGIAVGVDRAYGIGDLIWVEGAVEGRVVETNWRSTRIITSENDIATIPNSVVAKSRILNRSDPTEMRLEKATILLDPAVLPEDAIAMLRGAAMNTQGIADPAPAVTCTELCADGTTYEIRFSAPSSTAGTMRSDLLHQVARHARYAGVALGSRHGNLLKPVEAPSLDNLLSEVHVLQSLGDDDRLEISRHIARRAGSRGDSIYKQGDDAASLFIIARGTFEVTRDEPEGPHRIGVLGPGDYFGELSLLAGQRNAVNVVALTPFVAYEIKKAMLEPMLRVDPLLLHELEAGAARAQTLIARAVAVQVSDEKTGDRGVVDRIRDFFTLHAP